MCLPIGHSCLQSPSATGWPSMPGCRSAASLQCSSEMTCVLQNAVDMTIRAHEHAVLIPENPAAAQLPELTRPAGRARISLLSQLGKSSLAMEVDAGVLGGRVLAALRAERWRTAAEGAMRNPSRATGGCSPPLPPHSMLPAGTAG